MESLYVNNKASPYLLSYFTLAAGRRESERQQIKATNFSALWLEWHFIGRIATNVINYALEDLVITMNNWCPTNHQEGALTS